MLELKEVAQPVPKDTEILVKVHAVSLNDWDFGLMEGDFVNRIFNGLNKPRRKIFGSDIAGTIVFVGKNITRFKMGDEVYGDLSGRWGGFAEYCVAKEKKLELKPASMSFEQAASIPQAAMLAVQGLIDKGKIRDGQKILINGAGGGVGSFGVQIAKTFDIEVTGVDNAGKREMMRSIGFDHVIDYREQDFTKAGKRYDLILDTKTNRSMNEYARALNPDGKYVTVGGVMSKLLGGVFSSPFRKLFNKKPMHLVALKPNKDLIFMNELFEAGKMKPVIDGPYKLDNYKEAFDLFRRAEHRGKIVLTM